MERARPKVEFLKQQALEIRRDILKMLTEARSGHTGGSLSCVELLVALYFYKLRIDPQRPDWQDRDRFVISKGHGAPALYAVMAHRGFFPKEELMTLRKLHSRLQGHPDKLRLPYLEASTGSLGQGLSIACGMAMASRLDNRPARVYCLLGDGEIQEGQIWEAAMTAHHYRLDNLTALLDHNDYQIDGCCRDVKVLDPIGKKWEAFGWNVLEVDGHNFTEITSALDKAETLKGAPTIIVADTVKGKGVSFIEEDKIRWHGIAPKKEDLKRALEELEGK